MAHQIARVIAVVVLLGAAAAIATPRGRLPAVLRGLNRTLGRPAASEKGEPVSVGRRLLALLLVLLAVALAGWQAGPQMVK